MYKNSNPKSPITHTITPADHHTVPEDNCPPSPELYKLRVGIVQTGRRAGYLRYIPLTDQWRSLRMRRPVLKKGVGGIVATERMNV